MRTSKGNWTVKNTCKDKEVKKVDKVSIIVPCYNVESYVDTCLLSLQKQDYPNLEILMINDGSTDHTKEKLQAFAKKDRRFHYIEQENAGIAKVRNTGVERATGKYLCFVDGDDFVETSYVSKLYSAIQDKKVPIAVCGFKRIYDKKETKTIMTAETVQLCRYPAVWNKMWERQIFIENNIKFPVGKWFEDLEVTTKLLFLYDFTVIEDCLYNYRQNNQSIMHTYDNRIFQVYDALEEIEKFVKAKNIEDKKYEILEFIYIYHILIGLTFRSSYHTAFNWKMLEEIVKKAEKKYPKWWGNKYLKKALPKSYIIYLYMLKHHHWKILYHLLKHFHQYAYL